MLHGWCPRLKSYENCFIGPPPPQLWNTCPIAPFSSRPAPETGDANCPCVLSIGHLHPHTQERESRYSCRVWSRVVYMPPMAELPCQRWDSLIIPSPKLYSGRALTYMREVSQDENKHMK